MQEGSSTFKIASAFQILVAFLIALTFRWTLVDDAYITFRYSHNLVEGNGLLYNVEDPVLGTTSPLWALVLAAFGVLGLPLEWVSILLSSVLMVILALAFQRLYLLRYLSPLASLSVFFLLFLFFHVHVTIFSGMETILYILLVFFSLHAIGQERYERSGLLAGLATLVRPDGFILLPITLLFSLREWKQHYLRVVLAFLAPLLPWICFAYLSFGSPVPHSIAAKQILHPSTPLTNLYFLFGVFSATPFEYAVFVLLASGLILTLKEKELRPWTVWVVIYLAGLTFSSIRPLFYWYYTPIWFILISIGSLGILSWIKQLPKTINLNLWYPCAVFLVCAYSLYRVSQPDLTMQRYDLYRQIANEFQSQVEPTHSVYVCETGIFGWEFRDRVVLDASGINWPLAYEVRKAHREKYLGQVLTAPLLPEQEWSVELLQRSNPDWLMLSKRGCRFGPSTKTTWFQYNYEKVKEFKDESLDAIQVYRRRPRAVSLLSPERAGSVYDLPSKNNFLNLGQAHRSS